MFNSIYFLAGAVLGLAGIVTLMIAGLQFYSVLTSVDWSKETGAPAQLTIIKGADNESSSVPPTPVTGNN